jgi:hydrogenase maturation protease
MTMLVGPIARSDPLPARPRAVEVLVCGAEDRGDDAAGLVAARYLVDQLPAGVEIRAVGRLDVLDLLDLAAGIGVVVVDAATGIAPGAIVDLPLDELRRFRTCHPRSSHALAAPEAVGLAALMRREPLVGRMVAIGGAEFAIGAGLSPRVAEAIPGLVASVLEAVDSVREW